MIMIFEDDDSAESILSHVLDHGIAGIAGGRMAARDKLGVVRGIAERLRHSHIIALSTVNHWWGELAFVYDDNLYHYQEAKQLVVEAYDRLLADQGINPETYLSSE